MNGPKNLWRSMLFVPANNNDFVLKAHTRGADAIILDLEDSVPPDQKEVARNAVAAAVEHLRNHNVDVLVRINSEEELAMRDIGSIVGLRVSAIVVAKAETGTQISEISAQLTRLETKNSNASPISLIAQIESVDALLHLDEIAKLPRVSAMTLGPEDFCASAGMAPTPDGLLFPNQQILFACRRAGITPLGFVGSIADYSDLEAFRVMVRRASAFGFEGAFCIHPNQVSILNEELLPSPSVRQWAKDVVKAYEIAQAEGKGAMMYEGKMVDLPVIIRARRILSLDDRGD
ncbi:MAG: CoA ester lyase [Candidatus Berkelbacteria bacterium]|nr:CoA ester lyase [Candidatus Berkelbacteria bacterium]